MIALIPGVSAALASLPPHPATSPSPPGDFFQILKSASRSLPSRPTPPAAPTYTVQSGDNLAIIAKKLGYDHPERLAQANGLNNPDLLQIGQVLTLPEKTSRGPSAVPSRLAKLADKIATGRPPAAPVVSPAPGRGKLVSASWYGSQHQGRPMANGRPFNMYADTVAHKSLPLGTRLTLTNPQTGAAVQVQVTDRGPYVSGRSLDLSYNVARKLGVAHRGVIRVWMEGG